MRELLTRFPSPSELPTWIFEKSDRTHGTVLLSMWELICAMVFLRILRQSLELRPMASTTPKMAPTMESGISGAPTPSLASHSPGCKKKEKNCERTFKLRLGRNGPLAPKLSFLFLPFSVSSCFPPSPFYPVALPFFLFPLHPFFPFPLLFSCFPPLFFLPFFLCPTPLFNLDDEISIGTIWAPCSITSLFSCFSPPLFSMFLPSPMLQVVLMCAFALLLRKLFLRRALSWTDPWGQQEVGHN